MPTIQVRNVPEDLHRQLEARAVAQGRSLSDYVLDELRVVASRPTIGEWLAAVEGLPEAVDAPVPVADILTDERRG